VTANLFRVESIIEVQPRRYKFKTNEYQKSGLVPIIDQSANFIAGFTDEIERAYDGDLPVVVFGDHTCCLKFIDFRFAIGADGTQLLRPIKEIDTRYLYYALRAIDLSQFGYQRHFKLLKESEIPVPPIESQRCIASILGAYDDLIAVNRRRIAVLEEMARGLFEEWFVRFRFPGHEDAPIEDTQNGPLPVGWSWGRFADLASEVRDTVSPEAVDPTTPYVGLEHISRRSTTLAEHGAAADVSSLKARFQLGDILFGKIRPYFHKIAWAPFGGVASTDAIIWRPNPGFAAQALLQASSDAFVAYSVQTSNGTKMPRANSKVLADYLCALAVSNISSRFESTVGPMIESAASLQAANANLAASRDLLLPRLISGQLSVAQAESELEAA